MRCCHYNVTTDRDRANDSIACIHSSIRQSQGIERESIRLSSKLSGKGVIVLNPLVGNKGVIEIVGYKYPAHECVVGLSQHGNPTWNDPGNTNWKMEK